MVLAAVAAVGGVVDAHLGAAVELDADERFGGDDVRTPNDAARDGLAGVVFPVGHVELYCEVGTCFDYGEGHCDDMRGKSMNGQNQEKRLESGNMDS